MGGFIGESRGGMSCDIESSKTDNENMWWSEQSVLMVLFENMLEELPELGERCWKNEDKLLKIKWHSYSRSRPGRNVDSQSAAWSVYWMRQAFSYPIGNTFTSSLGIAAPSHRISEAEFHVDNLRGLKCLASHSDFCSYCGYVYCCSRFCSTHVTPIAPSMMYLILPLIK